jgi:hypothetical protein
MEPTPEAPTLMVAEREIARPVRVAVTTSLAAQPISRYDAVATPLTVETGELNAALPLDAHGEVNVTVNGVEVATPPVSTATLTLVVPNAERLLVPRVIGERLMFTAPVEYPTEPLTAEAVEPLPI